MQASLIQIVAAALFAVALLHTFAAKWFEGLAHRHPRHAGLFHILGEVEVVFGLWAFVLVVAMALLDNGAEALAYAESRHYTEPLFVFVVMVVAASRPVLILVQNGLSAVARLLPVSTPLAMAWLGFALVPLLGSLITEPAAMTLAALILAPLVFRQGPPEWLKYGALGVLFVNVSIGGTLTSYAAPPVLMVAAAWQWDSAFMASTFGWRACVAVLHTPAAGSAGPDAPVPLLVSLIHLGFLAAVVVFAHHPVVFIGLFLFFIGYTQAYAQHQSPLILKEGLLVGFFLAGLVVLGGMQQWWLQPIVSSLAPTALFFGALGLTALTDNAALTYLGSLIEGISTQSQYMLVAGAVAGGGLTVRGFDEESISALGLLAGSAAPTAVAAVMFLV